ncbi:BTB/POZ domain-containing protein POB1 isoform X1 [Brachypodium distachyon]|uniref:BTB domain-containing protein n=1 Tax=Brachypodium distachyon TaxID=15368 RepID=A0A0Q3EYH7_BRADI|nr:BTB/POZ domain-containing protein POB1 isoform X1 [Brachypodium distachyon]KQJ91556.1 hypothetical protein BRADI_4g38296v3 [Brachypodium distachyon]|eukprot:XP_024318628.1 BTB/POZ domain-containing protein POB1 isoform X1 [Brachypodium distachyon]
MEELSRRVRPGRFGFALNCPKFSDRVLRIEVVGSVASDAASVAGDASSSSRGHSDESARPLKRSRDEFPAAVSPPPIPNRAVNESPHDDSLGTLPPIVRLKKIHVSSVILAGSSDYFKKLFTNGMLESTQKEVTLRIREAEEMPLQHLLSFMYGEEILTTDPAHIIGILMVADKYQVLSCVTHCSELLTTCPISTEVALLYLNLDCSIPTALEPAKDAAKKFLCNKYQDFLRFEHEIMDIGPSGLAAILSSSDLKVPSEDYLFDFIVNWGRIQYPDRGERRTVFSSLLPLIRYSHLSCGKLSKIMKCQDIDLNVARLPLVRALFFKSDPVSRQHLIDGPEPWSYEQRAYLYRPLEVMQLHRPVKQCMVYMDLNTDDCSKMFPTGSILSEAFHFAKSDFFLTAGCIVQQPGPLHSFGLFLGVTGDCPLPVTVKYEFSARAKPSGDFIVKWSYTHTFTQADVRMGRRNLFSMPWAAFVDYDNNPWFIGGVMYLRAILTLVIE